MNPFFATAFGRREPPPVVLARFEQVEESETGSAGEDELQFSAIAHGWVTSSYIDRAEPLIAFSEAPISIVTMKRSVGQSLGWDEPSDESPEEKFWTFIDFRDGATAPAEHAMTLFSQPIPRNVYTMNPAPSDLVSKISKLASLDHLPDATEQEIRRALRLDHEAFAAAVYDVGQGNCNAVVDDEYVPLLYFDFGGGVTRNAPTFPAGLRKFCFRHRPTIVLSHWDWDHWSSAARDVAAQACRWIVPRQMLGRLGGVHASMAANIVAAGKLLVWPTGNSSISNGHLEIRKCMGKPRNHDGLALVISDPQSTGQPILLTGDAEYGSIPGALGKDYGALVASHHGGPMRSAAVPSSTTAASNRVVYSFGAGNSYHHALGATRANHIAGGWTCSLDTDAATRPSHVGIGWGNVKPGGVMPCAGACQLRIARS